MKKTERIRETLPAWPDRDYLRQKEVAGWRLVAVEWEREIDIAPESHVSHPEASQSAEEIPYGLRVASDCHHLEENPPEMEILKFLAEMITPRLIEVAPRILSGREWESRKKQMSRVAWNS